MKTKIGMLFWVISAFCLGSLFPAPEETINLYIWLTSIFYTIGLFLIFIDGGAGVEPKNLTLEEFDNMTFGQFTKVEYHGRDYKVASVNLDEKLFGLKEEDGLYWVRYENCEIIS